MRLTAQPAINGPPWNYGYATLSAARSQGPGPIRFALAALLMLAVVVPGPAKAQQASQPGFDPRQTERRFDALQSEQAAAAARSGLQMPRVARPEGHADSTPLFVLRKVSLTGARAVRHEEIARAYQPYLGKTVSQADLAAIAGAAAAADQRPAGRAHRRYRARRDRRR